VKLSKQALQILEQLKTESPKTVEELSREGFDQAMVNRSALELEEKGLIGVEEENELEQSLTDTGKEVVENGSPEFQLVERLREGAKPLSELQDLDLDVALGKARQKGWIDIEDGEAFITNEGREVNEDEVQERLESENFSEEDENRGLIETNTLTKRSLVLTEKGEEIDVDEVGEEFNITARTRTPRTGKRHFYKNIIDHAREKWVEMGFKEMGGDYVVPSLLNFDALYTPQDHPARELHDTFFLETPAAADLSEYGDIVGNIKQTHEDGWTTGSTGWDYKWEEKEAARNVLRTHTTAVSARKLSEVEEDDLPKKFFTVSRNFRNETVDRHHLAEFLQTDGIVIGKDVNFRHLKGYISKFFKKMGYDEFRLIPSYYPYTEMSVEVQVYDDEADEWIGLGGAGMFRPEVVKPLLGFEAKVLAWGLGVGRIAAGAAEIDDIRELYRNDIETLENTPVWTPE
jgi:phenylalanyl-tRNA synthetase alpha chain